ncbi:hypothetical protein DPMN_015799 [Dreissena polymorpha]|uniref:BTB domain-containing protein n=2 Tax=Dreissena polymorpha TaxID=45954 RepID=A0A9D4NDI6_DREPO|nr:hypothetical protein DPMN_015799 [Dreissena polymorpha]
MNSGGSSSPSSSDSDINDTCSELSWERERRQYRQSHRNRRFSATSVCTNPEEDVYVMVLQNRQGLSEDLKSIFTLKDICDVTFLVGEDRKPIKGVRAIIASRSKVLYELISAHEKSPRHSKYSKRSLLMKTLSRLSCTGVRHRTVDSWRELTIPMTSFDPESFQRLMNYIHSGTLTVDSRTVIGLLNAAYTFGFPEMRQACWDFALGCTARADNLQDMFESIAIYKSHKMTVSLMKMLKNYVEGCPALNSYTALIEEILSNDSNSTSNDI